MGPLHSFRMGLVTRKTKSLKGWNFQPYLPTSGKKRGRQRFDVLPGWCWEGGTPQFYRDQSFHTRDSSRPPHMYFSIWLFIFILYSKLIDIIKCSFEFYEAL